MGKIEVTERVTGYTELIGLLAYPIRHSMSPTMHNEAFKKLGLDYVYVALEVDDENLEDAVKGMRAMKMRGANISMPNKQKIVPFLDKLSPASKISNTVNTVVNEDGILTGHITDGIGCIESLRKDLDFDIENKKAVILGSGGAGTAIMVEAALNGVEELYIFNRDDEFVDGAKTMVEKINSDTNCKAYFYPLEDKELLKSKIDESHILINATGVGMNPMENECLIEDKSFLREDLYVFDCIYYPRETKLIKLAKDVGCKAVGGLGMMLYQGAAAFKLFTGEEMPVEFIKDILFD